MGGHQWPFVVLLPHDDVAGTTVSDATQPPVPTDVTLPYAIIAGNMADEGGRFPPSRPRGSGRRQAREGSSPLGGDRRGETGSVRLRGIRCAPDVQTEFGRAVDRQLIAVTDELDLKPGS